jgi:hypothetical protein
MATTRYEDRIASAIGIAGHAAVKFESHQALCGAGILLMIPALLSQGLLKTKDVYTLPPNHYYGLESIVLTLAFMALARIKNPEQLKQCKPGEIGKIMGLDRIPEVKCLREKIKHLVTQKQAHNLNLKLIDHWHDPLSEDESYLYIDGHQRIYYGSEANLPVKYISRQKLCLSATTEYWVNDAGGMPVMMVTGELTEKLEQIIEYQIIPALCKTAIIASQNVTDQENDQPICTLIFDREVYHPVFFFKLWLEYNIAVITYRKNVKDKWPEESFEELTVIVLDQSVTMLICEQKVTLSGCEFREIRRLTKDGHQTAIITTNNIITKEIVAGRMFGRWSQENFFRYMITDYDFDKMIEYGTEVIDETAVIVNPEYRQLNHKIKKVREKKQRLKAQLFPLIEQSMDVSIDYIMEITKRQISIKEKLDEILIEEQKLLAIRSQLPPKIQLKDMPEESRLNKLKNESKIMMNVIKMICYRAETSVANILSENLTRASEEKRMLVKQIIQSDADIEPDYQNKTLTITLHNLSANRFNIAVEKLMETLNQTQTQFPGSDLQMIFKMSRMSICEK